MNVLESDPGPIGPIVVLVLLALWFIGWLWWNSKKSSGSSAGAGPVGTAGTAPFMGPDSTGDKWVAQERPRDPVKNLGLVGAYLNAQNEMAEKQAQMICPHCQTKGSVTAWRAKRRRRLSATRVVTGVATLGASLPIAGTSKKNVVTELYCSNCNMTWDVA